LVVGVYFFFFFFFFLFFSFFGADPHDFLATDTRRFGAACRASRRFEEIL